MQSSAPSNLSLAIKDFKDGVVGVHIWSTLGWQEIRLRYRRSLLGPFWLTLSTGALIAGMGPLYGILFGQSLATYFPYLAISFITWTLIASLINECSNAFIAAEGYIKQIKLPLTLHILRVVWKNVLVFAHNAVIIAVVLIFYPPEVGWHLFQAPLGVLMIAVNGVWLGLLLGLLCARFRDIPLIIASVVQVGFFLTPVMWKAGTLGSLGWAAQINPLFHFLEIVRTPLLGSSASLRSWIAVLLVTVVGYAVTLLVFSRYRARIAYWV